MELTKGKVRINSIKVLLKARANLVSNLIYLKEHGVGETAEQRQKLGELEASI